MSFRGAPTGAAFGWPGGSGAGAPFRNHRAGSAQPHVQQPAALGLEQPLHRAGGDDLALIGIDFVVLLDVFEAIEIVDHDAGGFAQALWRKVAEPVDPLQPGAVAEMKARDRVDQPSLRCPGPEEIVSRGRFKYRAKL